MYCATLLRSIERKNIKINLSLGESLEQTSATSAGRLAGIAVDVLPVDLLHVPAVASDGFEGSGREINMSRLAVLCGALVDNLDNDVFDVEATSSLARDATSFDALAADVFQATGTFPVAFIHGSVKNLPFSVET